MHPPSSIQATSSRLKSAKILSSRLGAELYDQQNKYFLNRQSKIYDQLGKNSFLDWVLNFMISKKNLDRQSKIYYQLKKFIINNNKNLDRQSKIYYQLEKFIINNKKILDRQFKIYYQPKKNIF